MFKNSGTRSRLLSLILLPFFFGGLSVSKTLADSITPISERSEVFEPRSPLEPRIVFQVLKKKVDLTGVPA